MIDLHLHTTASDGMLSPASLIARATAVGMTTLSVTDHDTMEAVPDVEALAREAGIGVVPGIELTTVWAGRDVHVLGYFLDGRSPALAHFLRRQRAERESRAREIGARLDRLGMGIDMDGLIARCEGGPITRPIIARALVEAGHVPSQEAAFRQVLATGLPAYVPHTGPTPHEAVALVAREGGISSFAHPRVTRQDDLLTVLAGEGLDAVEVYHAEHSAGDAARYLALADQYGLLVTGGSDYHADGAPRDAAFGQVALPAEAFARLSAARARRG